MLTFLSVIPGVASPIGPNHVKWSKNSRRLRIWSGLDFPDFLPKQVEKIKDPYARKLASRIERIPVKHKTLIIWGEDDQIIDYKLGVRLHCEIPSATLRQIPECGHIPHVQKPDVVSRLIVEFVQSDQSQMAKPDSLSTISVPVITGTCTSRYLAHPICGNLTS